MYSAVRFVCAYTYLLAYLLTYLYVDESQGF